jgi:hypothetical protein
VENYAPEDLILRLVGVELIQLCSEAENLWPDISGQVFFRENRRRRVGNGQDRDDVKIAPARMERSPATTAGELGVIGVIRGGGVGRHAGLLMRWSQGRDFSRFEFNPTEHVATDSSFNSEPAATAAVQGCNNQARPRCNMPMIKQGRRRRRWLRVND